MPGGHRDGIELGSRPNGIEASKAIRAASPTTGVVLLSAHNEKQFLAATIEEEPGGWSYLLKQNVRDTETLVRAISRASWGILTIDPQLTDGLEPKSDVPLGRLTGEGLNILELVAQGYTDAAIAAKLHIVDEVVVRGHLSGICQTPGIAPDAGVDSRVSLVLAYLDQTRSL